MLLKATRTLLFKLQSNACNCTDFLTYVTLAVVTLVADSGLDKLMQTSSLVIPYAISKINNNHCLLNVCNLVIHCVVEQPDLLVRATYKVATSTLYPTIKCLLDRYHLWSNYWLRISAYL